jgi:hypothetical protein
MKERDDDGSVPIAERDFPNKIALKWRIVKSDQIKFNKLTKERRSKMPIFEETS